MASLTLQPHQEAEAEAQMHLGYSIDELLNCDNKPANTDTAFFTYGRFQPGHKGHKKMIMTIIRNRPKNII